MKLELTLLELNDLYVAVSRYAEQCREDYKTYGKNVSSINYFKEQLDRAESLATAVQDELYNECAKLDEAIEYVHNMQKAQAEDRALGNI